MWLDIMFSPMPNVPLRKSSVPMLKARYFVRPTTFPGDIHVALESPEEDPMSAKGRLKAISPEEVRVTPCERIAERIEIGAPTDELELWMLLMRKVSFRFEVIPTPEKKQTHTHTHAWRCRQGSI